MLRTITAQDIVHYTENNRDPLKRKQRFIREQRKLTLDLKIVVRLARRFDNHRDIEQIFIQYINIMYSSVFQVSESFVFQQPHLLELLCSTTNMFNTKSRLIESMIDNVFIVYDILKKAHNILVN